MKRSHRMAVILIIAAALLAVIPLTGMAGGPPEGPAQQETPATAESAAAGEDSSSPEPAADPETPDEPAASKAAEPEAAGSSNGENPAEPAAAELEAVASDPAQEQAEQPLPGEVSIGTAEELLAFADAVSDGTSEQAYGVPAEQLHAVLAADIDLADLSFEPVGTQEHPYAGTFDGAGHTISGLTVSADMGAGLFGWLDGAQICDLNLAAADVSARVFAGGVAGYAARSQIINCAVSGRVRAEENFAGGIAGLAMESTISGCETQEMSVRAVESAGGVAGGAVSGDGAPCTILDCTSGARVSADWYAGGVAGMLGGASAESCVFTGSVTCNTLAGGTIAGYTLAGGSVSGCSSGARVSGNENLAADAQVGAEE